MSQREECHTCNGCADAAPHPSHQVTEAAAEHLKSSGVTVKPYEAVLDEVRALGSGGKKLWVDPAQVCTATLAMNT